MESSEFTGGFGKPTEGQKSGATPAGERSGRQRPLAGRPASWPAPGDDRREDLLSNAVAGRPDVVVIQSTGVEERRSG